MTNSKLNGLLLRSFVTGHASEINACRKGNLWVEAEANTEHNPTDLTDIFYVPALRKK